MPDDFTPGVSWYPQPAEKKGGGRIKDRRRPGDDSLAHVPKYGGGTEPCHAHAADAYERMLIEARRDGIEAPALAVIDALRSEKAALRNFKKAIKKYSSDVKARRYVAPPAGYKYSDGRVAKGSAHFSGRAFDLLLERRFLRLKSERADDMRETTAWKWMRSNAHRFGFSPYKKEPWHWEYNPIGPDHPDWGTTYTGTGD